MCRRAPGISHLFFADDSIFFTRASIDESNKLKCILERHCQASGQVINYDKSEVSFSANVEPPIRTRIIESLEVREVVNQTKYLGLPSIIGRSKKVVFQAILDKIKKKLGGWKEKTLSSGGKEVLIKSVAQAMPLYVMNLFLHPETLIDDIHKALNLFWWGDGVKENPIRWCSWEKMCVSKFRGGLGFRHLGLFNKCLLAKQVWRLITSPTTLAARVLKARYFPISTFFNASVGYRPSYIWRSFLAVKELVQKGCKWNIGDGRNVNVWEDFWLANHRRLGPKPDSCEVVYVRDLLNDAGDDWNRELLFSLFPHDVVNKISCCFVSQSSPDTIYWLNSSHGQFSCKTAYFLALDTVQEVELNDTEGRLKLWHAVWKANVPNKIKLFIWRALHNYVPTVENMQIRRLNLSSVFCTHCGELGEDVMHILYRCSAAKEVWVRCSLDRLLEEGNPDTLEDLCHVILEKIPSSWELFLMILWGLWTRRNGRFHGQLDGRAQEVDVVSKHLLLEY